MAGDIVEGSDLAAIIAGELRNSSTYDQSELSQRRSLTLEYMRGIMPDVPPRPNGSMQTSRDINDTISWMLPSLTRTLVSNQNMVKYEQVKDEPPEWADQATAYTNYSFFVQNNGYQIVRNATYDSLAMGNGVVCSYWEPEQSKTETKRNLSIADAQELMDDENVEIITADIANPEQLASPDPLTGETAAEPKITVKIKRILSKGKICDETCKPENLFLNAFATTIEDSRFVAYLFDNLARSDLMEMAEQYGWDKDDIDDLPASHNEMMNQVSQARRYDLSQMQSSPIRSGDQVNLYRCFPMADVDGDGIAERLEVWFAGDIGGGTVLGWEVWEDDIPYTDIPCYPIPHRWDAESVADRTKDIQRVKTVLLRALLDSTYAAIIPQREVDLGSVLNPDVLTNPRFGATIWKKPGSADIRAHEVPYTGDKSLVALQAMDEIITKRTGVSKTMMALDPDALQNQTATANQNMRDAAYSQIELVARDMAEYGWAKFFRKRLKLAIKYHEIADIPADSSTNAQVQQDENGQPLPQAKFQQVQPGEWDENMAVTINVGLGTGSRDRDMAMLNVMLQGQREMAAQLGQVDPAKAVEFIPKIRNTAVKIAESAGLKNPEDYYPEITDDEVQALKAKVSQPQPDPAMALEQTKQAGAQQLEQVRGQVTVQTKQIDAQVDQHAAELKTQGDIVKNKAELEADLQTQEAERQKEITIESMRIAAQRDKDQEQLTYQYAALAQTRELKLMELGIKPILSAQDHAEALEIKSVDAAIAEKQAESQAPAGAPAS
jgi:hypothetical protein